MGLIRSVGLGRVKTEQRRSFLKVRVTVGSFINPRYKSLLKDDLLRNSKRSQCNSYSDCFNHLPACMSLRLDCLHLTFRSIGSCPFMETLPFSVMRPLRSSPFLQALQKNRGPVRMLSHYLCVVAFVQLLQESSE